MRKLNSRQRILFAVYGMLLAIAGDYLLGYGTIGTSASPDAYMGMSFHVVPDWRYALSAVLGFASAALFAVGAMELMRVMEDRYGLGGTKLYRLFRLANWGAILYFAFIHIGICMLAVVFNAGMEAYGDLPAAVGMTVRVGKSIAVPLAAGFILCDGGVTAAWTGMVLKGRLPVRRAAFICNPVMIALLGQLMNFISEGLDSGFESFGWLLLYLVCALSLTDKGDGTPRARKGEAHVGQL